MDLAFTKQRLAVFVDGCFWHGCPEHGTRPKTNESYWTQKLARNSARDAETDAALVVAGWTVVRVWEHELAGTAADRISALVRS
jgi:DNA mismatch endonuclease (patch repair protein)